MVTFIVFILVSTIMLGITVGNDKTQMRERERKEEAAIRDNQVL